MNLKFTNHFQERIIGRNINIDHVKKAIREPDSKKSVFEGKIEVEKKIGNKVIGVIYFKDGFKDKKDTYIVITAYYK